MGKKAKEYRLEYKDSKGKLIKKRFKSSMDPSEIGIYKVRDEFAVVSSSKRSGRGATKVLNCPDNDGPGYHRLFLKGRKRAISRAR